MAQFNPIDHDKIQYKYLGWGVDCRKDEEEWRESLKCYDGNQIRDIGNNINEIPHSEEILIKETYRESKGGHGGGSVGAEVPVAGLNAKVKIGFMAMNASNSVTSTKCVTKKTVTLQEDVRRDPQVTAMTTDNGSEVYYSKFELLLSEHILQYIEDKQRKSKLPAGADLGESVQTLQGENAIEKLQKLTKRNKPQLWQLVADACANFIDKIGCTHYVYSITLGKRVVEEMQRTKQETKIDAGIEAKAPVKAAVVGVDIGGGRQDSTDSTYHRVEEIGDDDKLEVIQAELKPLSSLISERSHNLKEVVENLLESYGEIMEETLSGPFTISCRDRKENEIYWYVAEEEIYGTTEMEKASKFYIKYLPGDSSQFCIIYQKAPRIASFVTFKEKEGLELVACAETSSIALVLEDNHYNAAELPKTPIEWTEKGPFFIKLGLENTGFSWFLEKLGIRKAPPYIGMAECTEESKPKYKAVSPESINKSNPSLMLFTVHIQHESLPLATGAEAGGSSALLRDAAVGANAILGAIRPEVLAKGANLLGQFLAGADVSAKNASVTSKISGLVGNNYNFPHTITASKMMAHYAHTV